MGYSLTTRLSSPLAQINEHYMSSLVVLAKGTGDKCVLHRRRRWASRTTDAAPQLSQQSAPPAPSQVGVWRLAAGEPARDLASVPPTAPNEKPMTRGQYQRHMFLHALTCPAGTSRRVLPLGKTLVNGPFYGGITCERAPKQSTEQGY